MPIPIILGVAAVAAGVAGVGAGINGAIKVSDASDKMEKAQNRHEKNLERLLDDRTLAQKEMDELGKFELEILSSRKKFQDVFEKIHNRPVIKEFNKDGIVLPACDFEKLKETSIRARAIADALTGAALGTAAGLGVFGALSVVDKLPGTDPTSIGKMIASLSGDATTPNATFGPNGGALAVGSGAIAAGVSSALIGGAALGIGLLVGGLYFNSKADERTKEADEVWSQMLTLEQECNRERKWLSELRIVARVHHQSLNKVNGIYQQHLVWMDREINIFGRQDYEDFNDEERIRIENTSLLVSLLTAMCDVALVEKSVEGKTLPSIRKKAVQDSIKKADDFLKTIKKWGDCL